MPLSPRFSVRLRPALLASAALTPLRRLIAFAQEASPTPLAIDGPLTIIAGALDQRGIPGEDRNCDVLMIARIDLATKRLRAISIPRDLYVEIPGFGYDKITRAYDFGQKADNAGVPGGIALMHQTIEHNFGLACDGTVLTTFKGFVQIVDVFGGIDVDNPYDLYDGEYPTEDFGTREIFYPAGPQHLDGAQALEFARTRHQDGDDGRVMRQQLVLRSLLDRARTASFAPKLADLVLKYHRAVKTDLGKGEQLSLALAAPGFTDQDVVFGTINELIWSDYTAEGMWIYAGDWERIPAYIEAFLAS